MRGTTTPDSCPYPVHHFLIEFSTSARVRFEDCNADAYFNWKIMNLSGNIDTSHRFSTWDYNLLYASDFHNNFRSHG